VRKAFYALLCLLCFAGGAYVWKVKNTGLVLPAKEEASPKQAVELTPNSVVVQVGNARITQDDIDWEYNLLTEGVFDKDSLTPIPDLGSHYHEELAPLRKALVGAVVERKLLFQFIQQDRDFAFDDSRRYSSCLAEWQQSVQSGAAFAQGKGKERLKARLCERSILNQYLKERLFTAIKVEDSEVVEYYKNHEADYKQPERAEIRQILLGDETEARKWRAQVNPHNFAEIARNHSLGPEAEKGGRLGPFAKGAMPAVFEVAFRMKKGEISDVMKSNYGYHIIMLLEKYPKSELSLEEARSKVVAAIRKKKEEDEYGRWVERALAAINVSSPQTAW
jgi:peptidyl-prolyl cis-trans isomerase C